MHPILLAAYAVIASGSNAATTKSTASFALDEKTYAIRWQQLIGRGERPKVDFKRKSVIFLLAGSKPTGGYTIEVKKMAVKRDAMIVDANVTPPPPDAMVIQAFTSPYLVVAVDRRDFKTVVWKR